jgi:hypothetical protein
MISEVRAANGALCDADSSDDLPRKGTCEGPVVEKATGWTSSEREASLAAASGIRSQAAPSLGVPVARTEVDDTPATVPLSDIGEA